MSNQTSFQHSVATFVRQHALLHEGGKYLVALSGGADSVSLLLVLHDLGYTVEACHCNFHLRGEESDRDEMFCVDLCAQWNIPLHRTHFDTRLYASVHHVSIEMAARELRYRYFAQLQHDIQAEAICVAHHRDDSVETMLINLVRGTGIKGLTGIAPRNGNILRPLLGVGRDDILRYLDARGQKYVTDSTNLVADVVRNRIRLQVLPLLREINPSVCCNMAETAEYLQQASLLIDEHIDRSGVVKTMPDGLVQIDKSVLARSASPQYVLHACLEPFRFSSATAAEVVGSLSSVGKQWRSATHQLTVDRSHILVRPLPQHPFASLRIPEEGKYVLPDGRAVKVRAYDRPEDFVPSKTPLLVTLDADKVTFPLCLRRTAEGDRFRPFGMKGSKLVSDYLTDCKCNAFEKEDQLLLHDSRPSIVWVVGRRTSQDSGVTAGTSRILEISVEQDRL